MPIQPEGLPSDLSDIFQGLPLLHLFEIKLAGQMAGATTTPLRMSHPLPLRFQGLRASEPTLRRRAPSGSPPLLVSSAHLPRWQLCNRRRGRFVIFLRSNWVGHHSGAPPTAESETGAPPLLEGNDQVHHLHLRHLSSNGEMQLEVSPTHPHERGHRDVLAISSRFIL